MEQPAQEGAGSREVPRSKVQTRRPGRPPHRSDLGLELEIWSFFGASLELGAWSLGLGAWCLRLGALVLAVLPKTARNALVSRDGIRYKYLHYEKHSFDVDCLP